MRAHVERARGRRHRDGAAVPFSWKRFVIVITFAEHEPAARTARTARTAHVAVLRPSAGASFRVAAGGDGGALAAWTFAAAVAPPPPPRLVPRRVAWRSARRRARGGVRACSFLTVEADVLASASEDRTVRLWDLQTGSCLCALVGARAAESVAFSPDAPFSSPASPTARSWRGATRRGPAARVSRHAGGKTSRVRRRAPGGPRDSGREDLAGASARPRGARRRRNGAAAPSASTRRASRRRTPPRARTPKRFYPALTRRGSPAWCCA